MLQLLPISRLTVTVLRKHIHVNLEYASFRKLFKNINKFTKNKKCFFSSYLYKIKRNT